MSLSFSALFFSRWPRAQAHRIFVWLLFHQYFLISVSAVFFGLPFGYAGERPVGAGRTGKLPRTAGARLCSVTSQAWLKTADCIDPLSVQISPPPLSPHVTTPPPSAGGPPPRPRSHRRPSTVLPPHISDGAPLLPFRPPQAPPYGRPAPECFRHARA